jgi:hypothetical protein
VSCAVTIPPADLRSLSLYYYTTLKITTTTTTTVNSNNQRITGIETYAPER